MNKPTKKAEKEMEKLKEITMNIAKTLDHIARQSELFLASGEAEGREKEILNMLLTVLSECKTTCSTYAELDEEDE